MTRSPTPNIARPTAIQPVATPVNTYVRPAEAAPSSLHELAQGLAAFDTGLDSWLKKKNAEQLKADTVRGTAAFNRNNQTGWGAAVSSGAVPANASPVFMESYKGAEGNFKGIKMREAFTDAYTMWEGRNSDDPEVFNQFLSEFIAKSIDTDDPEVLAGFNPHVELLMEQASTTHTADRSKTVYAGQVNTRAAIVGDILDHASIQGVDSGEGTNYELVMGDILQQRTEALASGIRMEDFDKQLAATIASKAIEHGDPYLLDLLDRQLPGYEVKLSSLPDYRDLKSTTVAALEVEARRQMTEGAQAQLRADKEAEGKIVSTVFQHLSETPLIAIPEDVIKAWEVYDPEARKKLSDARKSFMDEDTLEDPEDMVMVERMIQGGAGPTDILQLAADGVIKSPTTFRTLLDRAQKRQDAGADVLSSQTAKRFTTTIKERTTPDSDLGAMFAPDGLTDEGLEATKDFEAMAIDWVIKNPDATIYDREKFLYEAGELILKRIDRQDSGNPQYVSPADAAAMKAEADALAATTTGQQEELVKGLTGLADQITEPRSPISPEPATQPGLLEPNDGGAVGRFIGAQVQRPNYEPTTVNMYGADAPPDLTSMDETSRLTLEKRAESLGMSVEDYNVEIWKTVREGLGLSVEPVAPAPLADPGPSSALPDISGFVEPSSNPEVNPVVLKRFSGRNLPVSIRNNNMGAVSIVGSIEGSWASRQPGFIGTSKRPAAEGGYYAKYATPEAGVAAASRLLERYGSQGVNTPLAIVTKWSEDVSAHSAYASTLVKYLKEGGFNVGATTELDLTDPQVRLAILKAKSSHESGAGVPVYADAVFVRGVTYQLT